MSQRLPVTTPPLQHCPMQPQVQSSMAVLNEEVIGWWCKLASWSSPFRAGIPARAPNHPLLQAKWGLKLYAASPPQAVFLCKAEVQHFSQHFTSPFHAGHIIQSVYYTRTNTQSVFQCCPGRADLLYRSTSGTFAPCKDSLAKNNIKSYKRNSYLAVWILTTLKITLNLLFY